MTRPAEYNRWRRAQGRMTERDIVLLVRYFQDGEGLSEDGCFGDLTRESLRLWDGWPSGGTPFVDWCFPLPDLVTSGTVVTAEISSGFGKDGRGNKGRPNHWGVDVMYQRWVGDGGPQERYPERHRFAGLRRTDLPVYSRRWYCPSRLPVYAVGPGTVWSVHRGVNNNVKIDHHDVIDYGPLCTWYQHCHDVLVKPGDEVEAGQPIAIVGAGNSDLIHLHFEWRDHNRGKTRAETVVDPAPFLTTFRHAKLEMP